MSVERNNRWYYHTNKDGSRLRIHSSVKIDSGVYVDPTAVIGYGVTILGSEKDSKGQELAPRIGAHAEVHDNCYLSKGVIVGAWAVLCQGSQLEMHSQIGDGATLEGGAGIGERAMIGAGALIGEGSVIYHDQIIMPGEIVLPRTYPTADMLRV